MYNMYNYPLEVLNIYQEYLRISKYYLNAKTTSIPIRYLNINLDKSTYDEDALLTFDKYRKNLTGIVFDVYEFTPAFYTSPIINMTSNEQDKDFSRFSTIFNIQIYTIPKVYIGDLVQFYTPNDQKLVLYRVTNFRVPLNNFNDLPVYELDLEPAPVLTELDTSNPDNILASLNINNRYIYDYAKEEYIPLEDYSLKTKIVNIINTQYKQYLKTLLTSDELLQITYNDNKYVFYEINKWIYDAISKANKKFHHLDIYMPFGYKHLPKPKNIFVKDYNNLNNTGGDLNYYQNNQYFQESISPVNVDYALIDESVSNNTFNINSYSSDLEKIIVLLYLLDKLKWQP